MSSFQQCQILLLIHIPWCKAILFQNSVQEMECIIVFLGRLNLRNFTELYIVFVKKVVCLEGSRRRHPSTPTPHRRHHLLHIVTNLLMIFDSKFHIN
jgi:hypothetical protein